MKKFQVYVRDILKLSDEAYAAYTEEQKAAAFDEYQKHLEAEFKTIQDDAVKSKEEKEDAIKLYGELRNEALESKVDTLTDAFKAQGTVLKKLQDADKNGISQESFMQKVSRALLENKDKLIKASESRDSVRISIKANTSLITTDYGSSAPNTYMPMPLHMPGIHTTPEVVPSILEVVSTGQSDSPVVAWVNEQPIEGDAGWTAEGALKAQVAWKYENETATAKKVTAFVKVTTQALRNLKFLENRIRTRLRELILRKLQDGILNGDGTGDSPEGITPNVPGYTTTSFDGAVQDPNTMDAIMAMAGQIDELEFDTDSLVAVMNGVDIRKMKWTKDDNGQYVIPPFVTANGTFIDNMRVVKNNRIAAGFALVGDLKKFTVLIVEDFMLDIGLDGNDFTYNRRTILGEMEIITMLSDIDKGAFVYDEIETVKTAIGEVIVP